MTYRIGLAVLPGLLAGACGSDPAPARDFQVQTSFTLEPGQERYECYRVNVDDDVFIGKIATASAAGVHHQILAVADQSEPEGTSECGAIGLSISSSWIFVASDSPQEFVMPESVAYRVDGGSQLVVQMHLLNAGDAPLESTLTIDLTGVAEAEVADLAQLVAVGSLQIDLPPNAATTVDARCTLDENVSVFGLLPHMHFMGTTFKAALETSTIYDDEFFGETQAFARFEPLAMPQGAPLSVECNYFNTSTDPVVYGSAASDEMCFAFTYFYPAIEGQGPLCLN